ncbi:acyl carrier protein [Streptomyces sp. NPDC003006]
MSPQDCHNELVTHLETLFRVPAEAVTPDTTFADLGLDSVDVVELAVAAGVNSEADLLAHSPRSTVGEITARLAENLPAS